MCVCGYMFIENSVHFTRVLDVTCSASTRMKWWMRPCQAMRLDSSTTPVR